MPRLLIVLAVALLLTGACSGHSKSKTGTPPAPPTAAQPAKQFTAAAVWAPFDRVAILPLLNRLRSSCPPSATLSKCAQEEADSQTYAPVVKYFKTLDQVRCLDQPDRSACVEQVMRDTGGTDEAIAFYDATGWFLTEFRPMGPIDLGVAYNVWAANANEQYVLLNGATPVFFPQDSKDLKIDGDPAYPELIAAYTPTPNFPDGQQRIVAWPSDNTFESESALAPGGQRFIFQFSVNNGCHACATAYFARFAFDFGPEGTLRRTALIGICRGPYARNTVAGAPRCPPTSP